MNWVAGAVRSIPPDASEFWEPLQLLPIVGYVWFKRMKLGNSDSIDYITKHGDKMVPWTDISEVSLNGRLLTYATEDGPHGLLLDKNDVERPKVLISKKEDYVVGHRPPTA